MERSDALIKVIAALLIIVVIVYFAFFLLTRKQTLRTVEAVAMEKRSSASTTGYLVRTETPFYAPGDDVAVTAGDGAKVAAGETVAIRYLGSRAMERAATIRDLQQRIQQLTALKNGVTRDVLADESLLELSAAVTGGDLSDLYTLALNMDAYIISGTGLSAENAAEIPALQSQLDGLLLAAENDTVQLRADVSGIFSTKTDGLEYITPEMLQAVRADELTALFSAPRSTEGTVGKLVTDITWYYVTVMNEEDAAPLRVGGAANVEFSRSYSAVLTMTVERMGQVENGKRVMVFSCRKFMQDVAGLREMTGEVVFERRSGIRVPREALHVDEGGQTFVYILEGLRAKKVLVNIQEEDGDYYMVESGKGLRVRDKIILQAKNLYEGAVVTE